MNGFDPHRLTGRRFRFDAANPADGLRELPLAAPPLRASDGVEAWVLRMDFAGLDRAVLLQALSDAEKAHLDSCTHPAVADRYLFSRAMLRHLLGASLECDPASLRIGVATGGKPFLEGSPAGHELQFNVSHSGPWLLAALAWNRVIGADIEEDRPRPRMLDIAERFFHPAERREIREATESQRHSLFLRCWTLKEAHAKALGVGLRMDLSATNYSALMRTRLPTRWEEQGRAWWVLPLPGLQGSIATVLGEATLRCCI